MPRKKHTDLVSGSNESSDHSPSKSRGRASGLCVLVDHLQQLGKKGFPKGPGTRTSDCSSPDSDDTQAAFDESLNGLIKDKVIPKARILELGFVAPQWLPFVLRYFKDQGPLQEAYLWIMTQLWSCDAEGYETFAESLGYRGTEPGPFVRTAWDQLLVSRTRRWTTCGPFEEIGVSAMPYVHEFTDSKWFYRVYEAVGSETFEELLAAAGKVESTASVKKLLRLCDALRGRLDRQELVVAVRDKHRVQEALLLSVLPLPEGPGWLADLAERMTILSKFYDWSCAKACYDEDAPVQEALAALVQVKVTAGYAVELDQVWFQTHILSLQVSELPVAEREAVFLDAAAKPKLSKAASALLLEVRNRRVTLTRSLEGMMAWSNLFPQEEFQQLLSNRIVAPILKDLLFVIPSSGHCGFPTLDRAALRNHAGKLLPIPAQATLRLAHPADLEKAGTWTAWKSQLESTGQPQPFLQIQRELFTPERGETAAQHRFSKRPFRWINAINLLDTMSGWVANGNEAVRSFGAIHVRFEIGPEDQVMRNRKSGETVFGKLAFFRVDMNHWKHPEGLPFDEVPLIAFSETIRDAERIFNQPKM